MIVALLPPILALPLFWLRLPVRWLLGFWAICALAWIASGVDIFLYGSSWFIWGALFRYIAGMREEDDGDDFWEQDPHIPDGPRNFSKKSNSRYTLHI